MDALPNPPNPPNPPKRRALPIGIQNLLAMRERVCHCVDNAGTRQAAGLVGFEVETIGAG
ncbi:MAG: hypothetical protein L6Q75_09370 [Burkholderiaceae bacterium]|nr:hypothetical protein [Burkholderiaceae bacterium]